MHAHKTTKNHTQHTKYLHISAPGHNRQKIQSTKACKHQYNNPGITLIKRENIKSYTITKVLTLQTRRKIKMPQSNVLLNDKPCMHLLQV
jgi:hypothetical protein